MTTHEPIVISNTSPLLYLHQADCLFLLHRLYGDIIIPSAVQNELEAGRNQGFDVPDISSLDWIHVHTPSVNTLASASVDLGPGEAEVIALGMEVPNSLLILDDQLARRIADSCDLRFTGTLGILIRAKREGLISSVREIVASLRASGMWISSTVVEEVLRLSGEDLHSK